MKTTKAFWLQEVRQSHTARVYGRDNSAVATNKSLTVQRLWYFAAGRGGQEKTFAELRSQFALDVVPTKSYAANSAWQQLNVLAHNLCRSFQLDTIAETKGISRKRTCTHLLHTIRTIRFRIINKAGRLVRVSGRNALRMATNSSCAFYLFIRAHQT